jgi:thymidine kinase
MLVFRFGTMSSGKSLQLLALAYNLEMEEIPFIVLKSEIDDRDGEETIHSRAIPGGRQCISVSQDDNIIDIYQSNDMPDYVLVDEVQFLSVEQVEQLAYIVDTYGVEIYCYGLKTDFRTKLFPASQRLFEIADEFEEIKSYSNFGGKTMFNARIDGNGNIVRKGEQIEVGGDDRYKAMSRQEYFIRTNLYHKFD